MDGKVEGILQVQRLEHKRLHTVKFVAEQRLADALWLVNLLQNDVEQVDRRLRAAEACVGETRAHLRASGLSFEIC